MKYKLNKNSGTYMYKRKKKKKLKATHILAVQMLKIHW